MAIDLYEGQLQALKELSNGKILCGGVGTGKSIVSLAYYFTHVAGGSQKINGIGENNLRAREIPLYIFTTAKKRNSRDWDRELARFGLRRDDTMGGIVVDSWNNIPKYSEIKGSFVIFDEQRLVGNGVWVKAFYKIAKSNQWILLSATPGDTWMDYIPVFVANGYYRNRTDFIRRHVVYNNFSKFPKIDHYVEERWLRKLKKSLLVEIPFRRHTNRNIMFRNVEYDEDLFKRVWVDRWNPYEDQPIKNVSELFYTMRKAINTHSSRLDTVLELLETHKRLIVFYNFDYELELLRGLTTHSTLSETVEIAEWNGHKHQEVPSSDSWLYLVQYTAGAEAWECITTDTIAFYSLNYSFKVYEQCQGRIDRMNTPYKELYYYVFKSNAWIDRAIWKALSKKKRFNESSIQV